MSSLLEGKILLISSQPSQRSGLRKTLSDIGADNKLIDMANTFQQAKEKLAQEVINIVITDDDIEGHTKGFEILDMHIRNNKSYKDRLFILMVNEATPFLLSEFILKGGDTVVNKPFKNDTFIKTIKEAIQTKENLSSDEALSFEIQDAINTNDRERAQDLVDKFSDSSSVPALLARATVEEMLGDYTSAYEHLQIVNGLNLSFSSLLKTISVGVKLNKFDELLPHVEHWLKNYPLHHAYIPDIGKIIIVNRKFEVLDEVFDLFSKHKITDQFAKISLAAGFVTASQFHLVHDEKERAIAYALKGLEYSGKRLPIVHRALNILVKCEAIEQVKILYPKYASEPSSPEEKIADLMLKKSFMDVEKIISECMKLIDKKFYYIEVFEVVIQALKGQGKNAEELELMAKKLFPDKF